MPQLRGLRLGGPKEALAGRGGLQPCGLGVLLLILCWDVESCTVTLR